MKKTVSKLLLLIGGFNQIPAQPPCSPVTQILTVMFRCTAG
jgi:hypothetical protein